MAYRRVGRRRRIVDDHVAGGREADHDEEVAGRAVAGAVQLVGAERLRGHHRQPGGDESLHLVQRVQSGDDRVQAQVRRGVGGVERPVPGALVPVVVGAPGRLVDLGIGVRRVDPGQVPGRRPEAVVLHHHLRGRGRAPRLAAAVVFGVLALVDVLRVPGYRQLPPPGDVTRARRDGEPVGHVRGHRAEHPHPGRGVTARRPVQRQPQLVAREQHPAIGLVDGERVGRDRTRTVALAVHAGPLDVRVPGGPAAQHVPRGAPAVGVGALHLHRDPGPGGGPGVPGGHQSGGAEGDRVCGRGPGGVLPGPGDAGVRIRVRGGAGRPADHDPGTPAGDGEHAVGRPGPPLGPGRPARVLDLLVVGGGGPGERRNARREQRQDGGAGQGHGSQSGHDSSRTWFRPILAAVAKFL